MFYRLPLSFITKYNWKSGGGNGWNDSPCARRMGMNLDYETSLKTAIQTWGRSTGGPAHRQDGRRRHRCYGSVTVRRLQYQEADEWENADTKSDYGWGCPEASRPHNWSGRHWSEKAPTRRYGQSLLGRVWITGFQIPPDNGLIRQAWNRARYLRFWPSIRNSPFPHLALMPQGAMQICEPMCWLHRRRLSEIKIIAAHMGGYINWRPWLLWQPFQSTMYGDLAVWDNLAFKNYGLFRAELRDAIDLAGSQKFSLLRCADPDLLHSHEAMVKLFQGPPEKSPLDPLYQGRGRTWFWEANARSVLGLSRCLFSNSWLFNLTYKKVIWIPGEQKYLPTSPHFILKEKYIDGERRRKRITQGLNKMKPEPLLRGCHFIDRTVELQMRCFDGYLSGRLTDLIKAEVHQPPEKRTEPLLFRA